MLKETKEIIADIGIDVFGISAQNTFKMQEMEKTVMKYNVDALYDL